MTMEPPAPAVAPPPAPPSTVLDLTPEQQAASEQQLVFSSAAWNNPADPAHDAAMERVIALQRIIDGAAGSRVVAALRDGSEGAAPIIHNTPAPETVELRSLYPEPAGGWDESVLGALEETAVAHGVETLLPAMLHVAEAEMRAGKVWEEEESGEWLVDHYGEAEADALISDAQKAGERLPAPVRAWLRDTGMASNPRLLVAVAGLYRQRRQS